MPPKRPKRQCGRQGSHQPAGPKERWSRANDHPRARGPVRRTGAPVALPGRRRLGPAVATRAVLPFLATFGAAPEGPHGPSPGRYRAARRVGRAVAGHRRPPEAQDHGRLPVAVAVAHPAYLRCVHPGRDNWNAPGASSGRISSAERRWVSPAEMSRAANSSLAATWSSSPRSRSPCTTALPIRHVTGLPPPGRPGRRGRHCPG